MTKLNIAEIEAHTEGDYLRISDPCNNEAWIKSDIFGNVAN